MENQHHAYILFYQHLANVFYALAASDKKVREEELLELKKIIRTDWVKVEDSHDEFGTDLAYHIEIVFEWLMENDWNNEQILEDFRKFKESNSELFTDDIKQLILTTSNNIAGAFFGINKAESAFIGNLKEILA
ncbi:MAG: hypothetical protein H6605_04715 [Flavobacteriales bacterium]|nr:hypothetical protein [Flavobacteriales bacterium]